MIPAAPSRNRDGGGDIIAPRRDPAASFGQTQRRQTLASNRPRRPTARVTTDAEAYQNAAGRLQWWRGPRP